ncbi:MAG: AAA family ATPase [Sandaracinaceae bacterium]|nr:AAA family ATPase [Sandaracinaceae bacterium]
MDPDPLIGREGDLAALQRLLAEGARLVTVLGTAGVGKTRLAEALVAGAAPSRWPGGAYFVRAADAESPETLHRAVAATLGATSDAPGDALARVQESLRGRPRALVVIDDFEHLAPTAAQSVGCYLGGDVALVVTSRERLGLKAEQVLPLAPLASGTASAPAEALFVRRARAHGATLDDPPWATVTRIVTLLDGIPLAIELAAARCRVVGYAELLARLEERGLDALGAGARDGPTRHETLRAAIEASWRLLGPEEQRALARISAFRGGFDADAADAVLGAGGIDLAHALLDRSLLYARTEGGDVRLRTYASVQQFAAEQLAARSGDDARDAHARYYLRRVAELRGAGVQGGTYDHARALALLRRETTNLLAIVDRAVDGTLDRSLGEDAAAALEPLVMADRGMPALATRVAALLASDTRPPAASTGRAWHVHAVLLRHEGRAADSLAAAERALRLARDHADARAWANALGTLARLHYELGRTASAPLLFRRALAEAARLGELHLEGTLAAHLGAIEQIAGRDPGGALLVRAADRLRRSGDRRAEALAWSNIAVCRLEQGQLDAALEASARARALAAPIEHQRTLGLVERTEACVALERGDDGDAEERLRRAIATTRTAADRSAALGLLGLCRLGLGRTAEAREDLAEAVQQARDLGNESLEARWAACRAAAYALEERVDEARELLDAVDPAGRDPRPPCVAARSLVELAAAHAALRRADDAAARSLDERARALLAAWPEAPTGSRFEGRLLRRIVREAWDRLFPPRDALAVAEDGTWLRAPGGARQRVDTPAQRRLLVALAEQHRRRAGPAPIDALATAGWPGERLTARAAYNRAHVALSALRKLGMRAWLERADDGTRIAPRARVVLCAPYALD